ncbi:MFS transporter [Merismopedia glauca]|uniref:MFS transporter n=1 Tax=Merismopedia glauca CCAP 1448/3 TaxID=1296344 RepID=A0A2T1C280_9CYAN|nr:MFS transporter [Merismopedia glauca]PSB02314.1 MFS transporter [Merismopedia glauca CCAP 1448/3]
MHLFQKFWRSRSRLVASLGLPKLSLQIWILIFGRLLSQIGTGFTLFYAPIFFVNQVGLSATSVGLALGSGQITGIIGRICSGIICDSRHWGRKRTLLLSAVVSAIAAFVFSITTTLPILVLGNLLMGLGVGLYWPATEAVVADLTIGQQRQEAYALTRLGDSLGLGLGIVFGGVLIGSTGAYRALFTIDGISFLVFLAIAFCAIKETLPTQDTAPKSPFAGWKTALGDRILLTYVLVNIIFTTYISQLESSLPLYMTNFVNLNGTNRGFAPDTLSALFTWHLIVQIIGQIPTVRWLRGFSHPQALIISALIWGVGFISIWVMGVTATNQLAWAAVAMAILSLATITYTPSASALVADLAPSNLRGVYISINSLCWAVGYAVGPPLGGWALDQSKTIVYGFWLALAASVSVAIAIIIWLERLMHSAPSDL